MKLLNMLRTRYLLFNINRYYETFTTISLTRYVSGMTSRKNITKINRRLKEEHHFA